MLLFMPAITNRYGLGYCFAIDKLRIYAILKPKEIIGVIFNYLTVH